jgi:hypothetical protein
MNPSTNQLFRKISAYLSPNKLYVYAFILFIANFIRSSLLKKFDSIFVGMLNAVLLLLAIGYTLRLHKYAKERWHLSFKKIRPIVFNLLFNGCVYFTSSLFARNAVSRALELPVKDFSTTVQIISVCFYPLIWLTGCLLLFILAMLVSFSILFYHSLKDAFIPQLGSIVGIFTPKLLRLKFFEEISVARMFFLAGDVLGAFAICSILALAFDRYHLAIDHNKIWIRRIAYISDYQSPMKYTNIDHSRRMCFHDNGVISYATLDRSGDVSIEVKDFAAPQGTTAQPAKE